MYNIDKKIENILSICFNEFTDKYMFNNGTVYHKLPGNTVEDLTMNLILLELYWFSYGLYNINFKHTLMSNNYKTY